MISGKGSFTGRDSLSTGGVKKKKSKETDRKGEGDERMAYRFKNPQKGD